MVSIMKKAKIFQNGRSQAVRLPKEFRFTGSDVYIKQIGQVILLIPTKTNFWEDWSENLMMFSDDFMLERNQPGQQDRDSL